MYPGLLSVGCPDSWLPWGHSTVLTQIPHSWHPPSLRMGPRHKSMSAILEKQSQWHLCQDHVGCPLEMQTAWVLQEPPWFRISGNTFLDLALKKAFQYTEISVHASTLRLVSMPGCELLGYTWKVASETKTHKTEVLSTSDLSWVGSLEGVTCMFSWDYNYNQNNENGNPS